MTKKYRSSALEIAHRTAAGLYRCGLIDTATMREFDAVCLFLIDELSPHQIVKLREREGVSRSIFASYLNVPEVYIRDWECGSRRPTGSALKLLSIVHAKGLDAIA